MLALYKNKILAAGMALVLWTSSVGPSAAQGLLISTAIGVLPSPGALVAVSAYHQPPLLKGLRVYPGDPFHLEFILEPGSGTNGSYSAQGDAARLVRYFLASLTIPEDDMWVNLSPYEKDRIVPEAFGQTEMGRDLLAQDYLLKQITASVLHPEGDVGKAFWSEVYSRARQKYGTSDIPMETFNKVWIVPEKAEIFEKDGKAFIVDSKLKVMLESDYALLNEANGVSTEDQAVASISSEAQELGRDVIRDIVLPVLERDVNEGKNFAPLRQVYASLILAAWFKRKIKAQLLQEIYIDKNKILGVDVKDKDIDNKIYAQYVQAYKTGVYQYIKEDFDAYEDEVLPRKYFSGGVLLGRMDAAMTTAVGLPAMQQGLMVIAADLRPVGSDMSRVQALKAAATFVKQYSFAQGTWFVDNKNPEAAGMVLAEEEKQVLFLERHEGAWRVTKESKVLLTARMLMGEMSMVRQMRSRSDNDGLLGFIQQLLSIKVKNEALYYRVIRVLAEAQGRKMSVYVHDEESDKGGNLVDVSYLSPEGLESGIDEHAFYKFLVNSFVSLTLDKINIEAYIKRYQLSPADFRPVLGTLFELFVAEEITVGENELVQGAGNVIKVSEDERDQGTGNVSKVLPGEKIELLLVEQHYVPAVINGRALTFTYSAGSLLILEENAVIAEATMRTPAFIFLKQGGHPFVVQLFKGGKVVITNQTDIDLNVETEINSVVQQKKHILTEAGVILDERFLAQLTEREALLRRLPYKPMARIDVSDTGGTDRLQSLFAGLANGDAGQVRQEMARAFMRVGRVTQIEADSYTNAVMTGQLNNLNVLSNDQRTLFYSVLFQEAKIWRGPDRSRRTFVDIIAGQNGLLTEYFMADKRPALTLMFTVGEDDFINAIQSKMQALSSSWQETSQQANLRIKYAAERVVTIVNPRINGSPVSRTVLIRSDYNFENVLTTLAGEIGRQTLAVSDNIESSPETRFILEGIRLDFTNFVLNRFAEYNLSASYFWNDISKSFVASVMALAPVERYGFLFQEQFRIRKVREAGIVYFQNLMAVVSGRTSLAMLSRKMFPVVAAEKKDAAEMPAAPGGIDLNAAYFGLKVQADGAPVSFNMDSAQLAFWRDITGLTPVISSMSVLDNVARYMGVEPGK